MNNIRPMQPQDWRPVPLRTGQYSNPHPMTGFQRREGLTGNPLHPVVGHDAFEPMLRQTFATVQRSYSGVTLSRWIAKMPYWEGARCPAITDYAFVDAPKRLTTTSITIALIKRQAIQQATLGFYFEDETLTSLRRRLHETIFQGLVGNLGYFMTRNLVVEKGLPWSHNRRYPPALHLAPRKAYLGFHLFRDKVGGAVNSGFQGAHPAAVGVRVDGGIEILPQLDINAYRIQLGNSTLIVDAINDPDAVAADVALFTPGLWTSDIAANISAWRTYAPRIPLPDANARINIFIANTGNGGVPIEKVINVWDGPAPLPSFGAILSMQRTYFEREFGSVQNFAHRYVGQPVHIQPVGATDFDAYSHMLGGLVPAVVDGQHVYCAATVDAVLANMQHYGNARSPIAQAGRESQNFDLFIREPAGVLIQTADHIGWVLFDGRHELSIGASVVDVAVLLNKLQAAGAFSDIIEQAVFIDGGSAMKAYAVDSQRESTQLDILNRVAAGGRNGPGNDSEGLNLYTLLNLQLAKPSA